MPSKAGVVLAGALFLAVLSGCSAYRTIDPPWSGNLQDNEFATVTGPHVGDRIRVYTDEVTSIEGILADLNDEFLVIKVSDGEAQVITVPLDSIVRLEVFNSYPSARTTAIVATSSVLVLVIVKAATSRHIFSPDPLSGKAGH